MIALAMRGQCEAHCSAHWLSMGIGGRVPPLIEGTMDSARQGGAKRVRPAHEGTMESASLGSLVFHGRRGDA
jgi:hypothetical protein